MTFNLNEGWIRLDFAPCITIDRVEVNWERVADRVWFGREVVGGNKQHGGV